MNRTLVAATALLLVGVFAALAVSVVNARRPLDTRVSRSFGDAIASRAADSQATSRGCSKERPNFYFCNVVVRPPPRGSITAHLRLWVHGDGCWELFVIPPHVTASTVALARVNLSDVTGCAR